MKSYKKSKRVFAFALCSILLFSACAERNNNFNPIKCEEPYKLAHTYVARRKPSK